MLWVCLCLFSFVGVVAWKMDVVWEPTEGGHVDFIFCVGVGVAKVDGDALASSVDDGDVFLLEELGLTCCCLAAVASISDGSGGRDDSMPWNGGILEEFERGSYESRMRGMADEFGNVTIGCDATGWNQTGDVVDLGCVQEVERKHIDGDRFELVCVRFLSRWPTKENEG